MALILLITRAYYYLQETKTPMWLVAGLAFIIMGVVASEYWSNGL